MACDFQALLAADTTILEGSSEFTATP